MIETATCAEDLRNNQIFTSLSTHNPFCGSTWLKAVFGSSTLLDRSESPNEPLVISVTEKLYVTLGQFFLGEAFDFVWR
jgi:hypothetical protein